MELTEKQSTIANLKAELQTNTIVRNQQVAVLDLSKSLFGTEDSTYKETLNSIKESQRRITELKQNVAILEPEKHNKKW